MVKEWFPHIWRYSKKDQAGKISLDHCREPSIPDFWGKYWATEGCLSWGRLGGRTQS